MRPQKGMLGWSRGRPVSPAQDASLRADPNRLATPISAAMTSAVKGRKARAASVHTWSLPSFAGQV
jgi:hypothetical protein